jgi:hypothetical protein
MLKSFMSGGLGVSRALPSLLAAATLAASLLLVPHRAAASSADDSLWAASIAPAGVGPTFSSAAASWLCWAKK